MKLKNEWMLTEIGGEYVAVPVKNDKKDFNGIIRLNESGKDIWQGLSDGLDENAIADRLVEMYENIDHEKAMKAVMTVIDKLKAGGFLAD